MTLIESVYVSLLCISIVMLVLGGLFIFIKILSFLIRMIFKKESQDISKTTIVGLITDKDSDFSSGELKLHNVDERTAALIMAIVSDESGIPLSELSFKTISEIGNKTEDLRGVK